MTQPTIIFFKFQGVPDNPLPVSRILSLADNLELMAVIAIGHSSRRDQQSQRKPLAEFIVKEL
ncbi:MAG: hypothetical protein A2512_09235 [Deltaproteobacteria bacterium RIFOXYD12_FULL_56_24]|nr:MAG: hypothetical protein A2512_09235 [Deltaproteobacteria bacterium RIFOXYD12_FULL_56_24]